MKPLHLILLLVPWLASCDPITVHVFEPRVSGVPARTAEARARLRDAVEDAAERYDFVQDKRAKQSRIGRKNDAIEESILDYDRYGRLGMELYRDYSSGTDKVRLVDIHRFRRSDESKAIEREIRASLR